MSENSYTLTISPTLIAAHTHSLPEARAILAKYANFPKNPRKPPHFSPFR